MAGRTVCYVASRGRPCRSGKKFTLGLKGGGGGVAGERLREYSQFVGAREKTEKDIST
jgi:hypothetical protein